MVNKNNINNYMVINKIIFKKSKQHHTVRKIPKSNKKNLRYRDKIDK